MVNHKRLEERLLATLEDLEITNNQLAFWTDSIEELSEIQDAFCANNPPLLEGKSILDIGTDCIKPFYIALKFKPKVIIGMDEGLVSFGSEIQRASGLLAETNIKFYECSLFDERKIAKIVTKESVGEFDFVLVSKTLHHLRTGKCQTRLVDNKHKCLEDEGDCINDFEEEKVF